MILKKVDQVLTYRKEDFTIKAHFYLCEDSNEEFTTTQLDEINIYQVYNQYRDKHNLPFPHEIKAIREKYNISASKMSEILGFGINTYREYENGYVPSKANGNMIQLMNDPKQFKFLVEKSETLSPNFKAELLSHIKILIEGPRLNWDRIVDSFLFGKKYPDQYSGYRMPSIDKITEMVVYFTHELKPWTTQLNKLMFYADFKTYQTNCESMSGLSYKAIDYGPVPDKYNSIYEHIWNEENIRMKEIPFKNGACGTKFIPFDSRSFNSELFSESELKILEMVRNKFKGVKTNDIIELSHEEPAWIEHEKTKSIIDYTHAFDLVHL